MAEVKIDQGKESPDRKRRTVLAMVPWTETALAFGVYLLVVAAFPVNATWLFGRSFVVVLLLALPLSWFVTIVDFSTEKQLAFFSALTDKRHLIIWLIYK